MSQTELRFFDDNTDIAGLHRAFTDAFSDYIIPLQPAETQFREMLTRRGVNLQLSVGAFYNDELIGFNLNGLDNFQGALTVYDIATGVVPDHRRKGVASALFEFSLPSLRQTHASRYMLEVISGNHAAIAAYDGIGFRMTRLLQSFRKISMNEPERKAPEGLRLEEIEIDWPLFRSFWDWQPSWQNSAASVERSRAPKNIIGAVIDNKIAGYGIVYRDSGDIPQIGIHPSYRREGIGSNLIHGLQQKVPSSAARFVNVDAADSATRAFLDANGWEHMLSQQEMELKF